MIEMEPVMTFKRFFIGDLVLVSLYGLVFIISSNSF